VGKLPDIPVYTPPSGGRFFLEVAFGSLFHCARQKRCSGTTAACESVGVTDHVDDDAVRVADEEASRAPRLSAPPPRADDVVLGCLAGAPRCPGVLGTGLLMAFLRSALSGGLNDALSEKAVIADT
jgi:hypothetical protein